MKERHKTLELSLMHKPPSLIKNNSTQ